MTPQDQEFISIPEIGQYGDCQRAVIASLLDLPIALVPHFLKEANGDTTLFWNKLQLFCGSQGFAYLTMRATSGYRFHGLGARVYHEIAGPSPRGNGLLHAVVGLDGKIVFDPHPSKAGLAGDPNTWEHSYLVRLGSER